MSPPAPFGLHCCLARAFRCTLNPRTERFTARCWILPARPFQARRSKSRTWFPAMTSAPPRTARASFQFTNLPFNNYHLTTTAPWISESGAGSGRPFGGASGSEGQSHAQRLHYHGNRGRRPGSAGERSGHAHRHRPGPVRQAAARKPILLAQFAGDAGFAGRLGRFERPVSRARRSRVEFVLRGRPADHRSAKQGLLESDSGGRGAIDGSDRGCAARRIWRQDQPRDRRDHALRPRRHAAARRCHRLLRHVRHLPTAASISRIGGKKLGQFHFGQRPEHRPVSGWAGVRGHARSRQSGEPIRPPRLQALAGRHHQPEPRLHAVLVPDAEFVTTPKTRPPGPDWWSTTEGSAPTDRPVGPTDQRSKIRTFNIAPTWTRLVNPNTVFTFGGFVRQDQYNYYPSDNPFADLTPDLQNETVGQNRRLTNVGVRGNVSYVKAFTTSRRRHVRAHVSHRKETPSESSIPPSTPVCLNADGSPNTDPALTDPSQVHRRAAAQSGFRSAARLLST